MKAKSFRLTVLVAMASVVYGVGCEQKAVPQKAVTSPTPVTNKAEASSSAGHSAPVMHAHDHEHDKPLLGLGPHGGKLDGWGGNKYLVEFVVDHSKQEAIVYLYENDETTPAPVKDAEVAVRGRDPEFEIALKPAPLKGETDGASSRFVGQYEPLREMRKIFGMVEGTVGGKKYVANCYAKSDGLEEKK